MFVLGNLLHAVASVLDVLLQTLLVIIFINAVLSWVRPDPSNPIVMFLERVSDLVCDPIRRVLPTTAGGIDFAPFIAMLAILFVKMFLIASLQEAAIRMG